MAAVTPTVLSKTEYSGAHKHVALKGTLTTASDTITLDTTIIPGIQSIEAIVGATINTGMASTFLALQPSFSGLVITVVSKGEAGAAATTWGDITLGLIVNIDK